jgi:D-glycero-D-manno-heptose 1,7-bisphosphate phosphatase
VRLINRSGFLAVVVTNQAGVARGYFPESLVLEVHDALETSMAAGGARLDGLYYCPHHPSVGEPPYRKDCDCRKPRPGLLQRAAAELGADLKASYVVGDRLSDMELAWSVGARGVLVKSGYGLGELTYHAPAWARKPDAVAEDLLEAVLGVLASAGVA